MLFIDLPEDAASPQITSSGLNIINEHVINEGIFPFKISFLPRAILEDYHCVCFTTLNKHFLQYSPAAQTHTIGLQPLFYHESPWLIKQRQHGDRIKAVSFDKCNRWCSRLLQCVDVCLDYLTGCAAVGADLSVSRSRRHDTASNWLIIWNINVIYALMRERNRCERRRMCFPLVPPFFFLLPGGGGDQEWWAESRRYACSSCHCSLREREMCRQRVRFNMTTWCLGFLIYTNSCKGYVI